MINAFLFDFDGVVVDSEPIHTITKGMALDFFGIDYPQDIFDKFKGTSEEKFFVYVSEELDPQNRPFEQFKVKRQEILSSFLSEMPVIDGFFDIMEYLKYRKIKTSLVTSSTDRELQNIDKYLNLTSFFEEIISADSTKKHKPNPDPYLKALEVLNLKGEDVIVIEDSENGIISGKLAGCKVYALTTTFSEKELIQAGADKVFKSYKELMSHVRDILKI